MKCKEALYIIDNLLDEDKESYSEEELMQHLSECESCKKAYDEIKSIKEELENTEFLPLPDDFHSELTQKLIKSGKNRLRSRITRYSAMAACAVIVFMTGVYMRNVFYIDGISSGSDMIKNAATYDSAAPASAEEYGYSGSTASMKETFGIETASATSETAEEAETDDMASNSINFTAERKLVKNGYISILVDDYDSAVGTIKEYTKQLNGYVESSDSSVNYDYSTGAYMGKFGNMTVCVDSGRFNEAMDYIKSIGEVTYENEYTDDITSAYVDTESRLMVKEQEKERLMALLEKAESIEDIISIESRLTDVIESIEASQAQLKSYDSIVDYSRINLNISEKDSGRNAPQGTSFSDRAKSNFTQSIDILISALEGVVLFAAKIWAPALVTAAVLCVIIFIIKRSIKNRQIKK